MTAALNGLGVNLLVRDKSSTFRLELDSTLVQDFTTMDKPLTLLSPVATERKSLIRESLTPQGGNNRFLQITVDNNKPVDEPIYVKVKVEQDYSTILTRRPQCSPSILSTR
jgi:hypothetical protein